MRGLEAGQLEFCLPISPSRSVLVLCRPRLCLRGSRPVYQAIGQLEIKRAPEALGPEIGPLKFRPPSPSVGLFFASLWACRLSGSTDRRWKRPNTIRRVVFSTLFGQFSTLLACF